jgi:hypothetical protein
MMEIIEVIGVILRGIDVTLKVLDRLREKKEKKSRDHPHK